MLQQSFTSYKDFSNATFTDIIAATGQESVSLLAAYTTGSIYLEQEQNGEFVIHELPATAQNAPLTDFLPIDINQDGWLDALAVGNDYQAEKNGGRFDALNGLCLINRQGKGFDELPVAQSGFFVPGDGRQIALMGTHEDKPIVVVSQNRGELLSFRPTQLLK